MKYSKFYGSQHVSSKWLATKKGMYKVFKGYIAIGSVMVAFYLTWLVGSYMPVREVFAEKTITGTSTPIAIVIPPILERIAQCESGNSDTKNGQIIFKANTNGTTDIGKYQVNSIWATQATKLGYNLTVPKDNEAFALWLLNNYGSSPWMSSSHCWSK